MSTGLIDQALGYVADHAWKGYDPTGAVDIKSYTSSHKYTVPSNGIVRVQCRAGNSSVGVYADGTLIAQQSSTSAPYAALVGTAPVFKGQEIYVDNNSQYNYAAFVPFVNRGGGSA